MSHNLLNGGKGTAPYFTFLFIWVQCHSEDVYEHVTVRYTHVGAVCTPLRTEFCFPVFLLTDKNMVRADSELHKPLYLLALLPLTLAATVGKHLY